MELSGDPLNTMLTLNYLKANGPELLVQTRARRDEPKSWDFLAIVNANPADFGRDGKLDGFKEYATDLLNVSSPVASLRQAIMRHAEHVFSVQGCKPDIKPQSMIEHSETKFDR